MASFVEFEQAQQFSPSFALGLIIAGIIIAIVVVIWIKYKNKKVLEDKNGGSI